VTGVTSALSDERGDLILLGEGFADVEKISLDHAVMERTDKAVVIPIDVGWDDVGSFEALWNVSEKDDQGNVIRGDVVVSNVTGSLLVAMTRSMAVSEIDDVIVVESADGVLVVPLSKSQTVRDLVEKTDSD
jgi:mannose-1-phosphate guanylyltransferase